MDQDIFTLTDNFKIYRGRHTFTIGTHNEFGSFYNLFIRQNFGSYRFDDIATFINGDPAYNYDRSFSLVDNVTGDGSAAAAEFSTLQIGLYAQDKWQITNNFDITLGLRVDMPLFS